MLKRVDWMCVAFTQLKIDVQPVAGTCLIWKGSHAAVLVHISYCACGSSIMPCIVMRMRSLVFHASVHVCVQAPRMISPLINAVNMQANRTRLGSGA